MSPDRSGLVGGHELLIDAALALAAIAFTCVAGSLGVYLFDTSINYAQGWLIYNGLQPYRDFTGPLAPGSGLFTALGFALFGVSYRSSVWTAALLTGGAVWLCIRLLRPLIGTGLARTFGLALPLMTLPLIGTLYYNHLLLVFLLVANVAILAQVCSGRGALLAHAMAALATLTKLHIGGVQWLLIAALDLSTSRVLSRRQWLLRAAFPLALLLVLLVITRGDLASLLKETLRATSSGLRSEKFVRDFGLAPGFVAGGQPLLGPLVFTLWLFAQIGVSWDDSQPNERKRVLQLSVLGLGALAVQVIFWLTSGDGRSAGLSTLGFTLVCGLALQPRGLRITAASSVPLLLGLLWFAVPYALSGARRSYIERSAHFEPADAVYRFTGESRMPFFAGIELTYDHVHAFDFVDRVSRANPRAKLFFGPSLEMMYAATRQLPPRGWPLWFHWGLSVRLEDAPRLRAIFERERPALAIFTRDHTEAFLQPVLDAAYERYRRPELEGVLFVFVRKDAAIKL